MDSSRGQTAKDCNIINCTDKGRVLANLGGIEIIYCAKHRKKYGERIINALINSVFNYKLSNFLTEIKTEIFMDNKFFCKACGSNLKNYIISKTNKLEAIVTYAEENHIQETGSELI